MYTLKTISHYLKLHRKQYLLLAFQMTVAFALIFVIKSSEISVAALLDAAKEGATPPTIIIELGEGAETDVLLAVINGYINGKSAEEDNFADNGNEIIFKKFGNMWMLSYEKPQENVIEQLFAELKTKLASHGDGFSIILNYPAGMAESMASGITNAADILKIAAAVIMAVAAAGFIGFIMLMLLQREHDILAAFLCGVRPGKIMFATLLEIFIVGIISFVLGSAAGWLAAPVMGAFGAGGRYKITPEISALGFSAVVLLTIYALPTIIFVFKMARYNPIVAIRGEEN